MRACRGQAVEIVTLEEFDRRLRLGASSLSGWRLVELDLTERSEALRSCRVAGALFLGCAMARHDEESVRSRGAIVFPELPDIPVDTYRSGNIDLESESSRQYSIGAAWDATSWLNLTVDWYRIEIDNRIRLIEFQELVDFDNAGH